VRSGTRRRLEWRTTPQSKPGTHRTDGRVGGMSQRRLGEMAKIAISARNQESFSRNEGRARPTQMEFWLLTSVYNG